MKKIAAFESAIENQVKDIRAEGINPTAFWAYRNSIRCGNDLIDFNDVIWGNDIEAIAETFEANAITAFTISSNFSGLIKTLVAFEKAGYKMVGTTQVNASYTDWSTGKPAKVDALMMQKA
jgi:hypothetical protein